MTSQHLTELPRPQKSLAGLLRKTSAPVLVPVPAVAAAAPVAVAVAAVDSQGWSDNAHDFRLCQGSIEGYG